MNIVVFAKNGVVRCCDEDDPAEGERIKAEGFEFVITTNPATLIEDLCNAPSGEFISDTLDKLQFPRK